MSRRAAAAIVALLAALVSVQVVTAPHALAADPAMYQGPTFAASGPAPTEDKPQSKLWFNDGFWWALMRTNVNGSDGSPDITIHRLQADHTWRNTGVVVDSRPTSSGDALWENNKLYVASRVASGSVRVNRFSYIPSSDTYTTDAGYPKNPTSGSIESVSVARDTTGKLWITFTKPNPSNAAQDQVFVSYSTNNGDTWATPFLVPVSDTAIDDDDLSAIVAFGGQIGVMWSDQQSSVVRFAVHKDTDSPTTGWTMETPVTGPRSADDHINLKSLIDASGRVYAAIKTSRGDSSTDPRTDPSIQVLMRSSSGTWTTRTAATVEHGLTRPQIALDTTNALVYVVMSTENGGNVYYKTAPLDMSQGGFTQSGRGSTMLTWSGALLNNATLAKAPVNGTSDLVVLASDEKNTRRYYHAELDLGGGGTTPPPGDSTPPTVPTGVSATADGPTQVTVRWTASTDATGVASYQVKRNGSVVANAVTSGTSFVDTTVAPSTTYNYTVNAVDGSNNRSGDSAPAPVTTPAAPPPDPAGAVSYVASSTGGSAATTTVSLTPPAGVTAGDVLVANINLDDVSSVSAVPSGWRLLTGPLSVGTSSRIYAYYKVAGSTEPSSYGWTLGTAVKWNGVVGAFRGVNQTTPLDTTVSTKVNSTGSTTLAVPGVTTTVAGAMLVGGAGPNSSSITVTPPSGWTEAAEVTGQQTAELARQARPTAGATGTATWGLSSSIGAAGWLVALRPA